MKFALKDHRGAATAIGAALHAAGHVPDTDDPDVFLIDWDGPVGAYRELIDFYRRKGSVVLLYPHGAGCANLQYDSLFAPYENVDGQLVVADGEREYLNRLGIDRPTCTIGWSYCDPLPFRAREEPYRVLFAPTHPMGAEDTYDWRRERNREIFEQLVAGSWKLTVRTIFSPEANGLRIVPGVRYVVGSTEISTAEIDVADVVVAGAGTFPTIAIARGTPTVMYSQFEALYGVANEKPVALARRGLYEDIVRYPHDVDDGPLGEVIRDAARNDDAVAAWRERWIGESFDPKAAVATIEKFVKELSQRPALAS